MRPVFIGDEVSAAAYRLAGLDARVVTPEQMPAAIESARGEKPPLVLLGAASLGRVEPGVLEAALRAFDPPVVVVPDAALTAPGPDLAARARGVLGIEA